MKNKITTFKNIRKSLRPYSATLIGSSFDPFNSYYFRLLRWAAKQSRPLVAIVHPDKIVSLRRGFARPSEDQNKRAKRLAALDFVDYVVISGRVAHDPRCLKMLRPRFVIFQQNSAIYHEKLFKEISRHFKKVYFKVAPLKREVPIRDNSLSFDAVFLRRSHNAIYERLLELASKSKAKIGKISAVLVEGNKIIDGASNSVREKHAEIIILKRFKPKKDLIEYSLYVLIPPCPMCAEVIIRAGLKKVFYLFDYGDKIGVKLLRARGVKVKRF